MFKKLFNKLFGKKADSSQQKNSYVQRIIPKDLMYEGTPGIKKLVTEESPKQILSRDFPDHPWPISGGWGYTKEDAVIIEVDNSIEGVHFEYEYLKYRTYEEAIVFQPKGQQLAGLRFETVMQSMNQGNKGELYDKVTMKVYAFKEEDFEFLRSDWELHNGYENDEEGEKRHTILAQSKQITFEITGWFEISNFFGKF